jgi:hypothetical protein
LTDQYRCVNGVGEREVVVGERGEGLKVLSKVSGRGNEVC